MTDTKLESDILLKNIKNRRTIGPSQFSDKIIADADIWQLLEAANWAPSHRNTEPWRFHVFAGKAKQALSDSLIECYTIHTPSAHFSAFKAQKIGKKALGSSHIITIVMNRDEEERVPEWEELAAVSSAVQNLWLAATSMGFAGYWSSPKLIIENARDFLTLDENEKCLGFFYIGYPDDSPKRMGEKGDIKEKVEWYS